MTTGQEATPTKRGDELANILSRELGTTREIRGLCALIARHARTHERIQETWCNDEMSDKATARLEAREARLEARIADLVATLPHTDHGPFTVRFDGDPRGHTVKIICPVGGLELGNTWGDRRDIGVI